MIRLPSMVIAFVTMLAVSTVLNHVFGVDYFYNPIFFAFFGLGLSDLIHRRLERNLDPPSGNVR